MDDSSTPEARSLFIASSVCSILGVKGLRFRPHGSNQKAHVILRRIAPTEVSDNQGDLSSVVRFSLFAQKRIEVKPGKEILLTVASEDGSFSDVPVIFEGDRTVPQVLNHDSNQQLVAEETQVPANSSAAHTMPPKMRRAWTKKLEVSTSVEESPPPVMHISVGVQAEPPYAHSSVQAEALDCLTFSRSTTEDNPGNLPRAASLALPSGIPVAPHSSEPRRYTSLEVQTDFDSKPVENTTPAGLSVSILEANDTGHKNQECEGRSLIPMEIDSRPSSREASCSSAASSQRTDEPVSTEIITPLCPVSRAIHDMMRVKTEVSDSMAPSQSSGQTNGQHFSRDIRSPGVTTTHNVSPTQYPDTAIKPQPPSVPSSHLRPNAPSKRTNFGTKGRSPSIMLSVSGITSLGYTYPAAKSSGQDLKPCPEHWQPSASLGCYSANALASSSRMTLDQTDSQSLLLKATSSRPASPRHDSSIVEGSSRHAKQDEIPSPSHKGNNFTNSTVNISPVTKATLPTSMPPLPLRKAMQASNSDAVRLQSSYNVSRDPKSSDSIKNIPPIPTKHLSSDHAFTPPKIGTTLTSWLSPFDDCSWDADAVPGLTASSSNKPLQEMSPSPLALADDASLASDKADDEQRKSSCQYPFQSTRSSNGKKSSAQSPWTERSTYRAPDEKTAQLSMPTSQTRTTVPPSGTEQSVTSPTTNSTYEPAAVDRSCPVERSKEAGPRGMKRVRPSSPERPFPVGDATIASPALNGATEHGSPSKGNRPYPWPVFKRNHSANLSGLGNLAVQSISLSSDGSHFALSCADKTLRIWNNVKRAEIARFSHNSPIVNVNWLEGDVGVVTFGEDGIVGKWTRVGGNYWQWAKIVDAGCEKGFDDKTCMAYHKDRIAVSFPKTGVKVWLWLKGTWQAQRSIVRLNVTAIKFVEDGTALLGGTSDGVLWYCEIPNGTLRAYSFLHKTITTLNLSPSGSHVLVGQVGGRARLVSGRQCGNRGAVEVSYLLKEQLQQLSETHSQHPGAVFAAAGQAVIFGSVGGCVLVWDKTKATVSYGLEHDKDDIVQAVSCIDGLANREGWIVTGTQKGRISWWTQTTEGPKRVRMG